MALKEKLGIEMTVFFHIKRDGNVQILTWNEYLRAFGRRKDWVLGWKTNKYILLVKNEHAIGSVSIEAIKAVCRLQES